ncbi:MAG TPA: carbon-nitrogen hydrolase family protein [Planctomycetota bacterium]|nr:carbon-nitrogen hydrolase family protein [Planctomycetota bacterium]
MMLILSLLVLAVCSSEAHAAEAELRVAVAQPLTVPGDVEGNIERMAPLIKEASERGAGLIVFSECAITGYDLKGVGAKAALSLDSREVGKMSKLAKKQRITIIAGLHEKQDGRLYNSACIFFPDGNRVVQRKHNVMDSEKQICPVLPGERKRTLFNVNGFTCAVLICADTGIPGIFDELAGEKCDAIISITAGAGDEKFGMRQSELGNPEKLKKYLDTALTCIGQDMIATSLRLRIAQVACNQSGWKPETGYFHPGGSIVVDHTGETSVVIPPRFVLEHVKADMAIGTIHKKP